ncbi:MAG: DnrO protein, partial [Pseudoxanthomonas sp.]|nr:DnrO protein [Pseudoxanthomonas sp.]
VSATAAPAQRWAADANLSHGMAQVRASVEALGHAEHGHMGPGQVVVLARTMDGYIGDILATCKLDPNADAALHGVLAQLLRGTDALKQGESLPVALATMRQALEQYPRLFDDPQWHALAPSGH